MGGVEHGIIRVSWRDTTMLRVLRILVIPWGFCISCIAWSNPLQQCPFSQQSQIQNRGNRDTFAKFPPLFHNEKKQGALLQEIPLISIQLYFLRPPPWESPNGPPPCSAPLGNKGGRGFSKNTTDSVSATHKRRARGYWISRPAPPLLSSANSSTCARNGRGAFNNAPLFGLLTVVPPSGVVHHVVRLRRIWLEHNYVELGYRRRTGVSTVMTCIVHDIVKK